MQGPAQLIRQRPPQLRPHEAADRDASPLAGQLDQRAVAALRLDAHPVGPELDPVGAPTERGLALLHQAIGMGKGVALLRAFMQVVWSEGVDAGSDAGLQIIATRAGLDAATVSAANAASASQPKSRAGSSAPSAGGVTLSLSE